MILSEASYALRSWLANSTGISLSNIFIADQDFPKPEDAYITIKLNSFSSKVGEDEEIMKSDGSVDVIQSRTNVASINYFGANAYNQLLTAWDSLDLPTYYETFDAIGLVVIGDGNVRDLTELVESRYQARAQVDLEYYFKNTVNDEPGYIEAVGATGEILNSDPDNLESLGPPFVKLEEERV